MYNFLILPHFLKQTKKLSKRYKSLNSDITGYFESFDERLCIHLGEGVYKCRLGSSSVQRGKSKSFRLVVKIISDLNLILPVLIYFKGDLSSVSRKDLNKHLKIIYNELKNH